MRGAERPFLSREDVGAGQIRLVRHLRIRGAFQGWGGRGWGGDCVPPPEFCADRTQPQQSQCGVGGPASLPPFLPALSPQSARVSQTGTGDPGGHTGFAPGPWGPEKRPWPQEERALTAQLAGAPPEPRGGPVCLVGAVAALALGFPAARSREAERLSLLISAMGTAATLPEAGEAAASESPPRRGLTEGRGGCCCGGRGCVCGGRPREPRWERGPGRGAPCPAGLGGTWAPPGPRAGGAGRTHTAVRSPGCSARGGK